MEHMHFLLESRQIKLLCELHCIYPIHLASRGGAGRGKRRGADMWGGLSADGLGRLAEPLPLGSGDHDSVSSRDWIGRAGAASGNDNALLASHLHEGQPLAICGLPLPVNLLSGGEDELVYAALGNVVHVLTMISKYLMISLRYQLVYAASRSQVGRYSNGRRVETRSWFWQPPNVLSDPTANLLSATCFPASTP